jgi:hypothetical protein
MSTDNNQGVTIRPVTVPGHHVILPRDNAEGLPEGAIVPAGDIAPHEMALKLRELRAQRVMGALARPVEEEEAKRQRAKDEADVVAAARRSQAEIRRHVDAYLKEHFEGLAGDVAEVTIKSVSDKLLGAIHGLEERNQIQLDRMGAHLRAMVRTLVRELGKPAKTAKRAKRARKL